MLSEQTRTTLEEFFEEQIEDMYKVCVYTVGAETEEKVANVRI
jgi:hypothetical protein